MKRSAEKVTAAKEAAMKALADRDLTRAELVALLVQRRYSSAVAEAAVLELETLGIIDDRRVATIYLQRRLDEEKPSRALLEAEMLERGLDPGLVQTVLHEALQQRDEGLEALELARDRVRRSRPDLTPEVIRRRVFAFLSRRGYDEETARHAVETAADEYLGRP